MAIQSRVTEGSIHTRVLANLQRNIAQSAKIQEQLSSGKQLNRPSDSPTGTITSMELRGETRSVQQHVRNADDGVGWLGTIDNALTQSSELVNRTRGLALQGLNSAGSTSGSREALAVEIDEIRQQLIGHANSTYLGRPVFGGTTAGEVAYRSDGTYAGDAGTVERKVGTGVKVRVDVTGTEVFGADGADTQLFAVLADISKSLRDNDSTALNEGLKNLDAAGEIMKGTLSDAGARYNRVTQMRDTAEDRMLTLKSQLSDVEDIDLPKTIMEMQLQQTAYQAALAASAKVIQPSLIDYLEVTMSAVVPSLPTEERMTMSSETLPIIELAAPMPGFPAHRQFALVRLDEEGLLYALTSADDPELRFLVAPPANLFPDYSPEIDDNTLELLGNPTADQILTMVVITAGEEQTSANLLAPIVINQQNLKAVQVILTGTGMPVRQLLTAGAS